MSDLDRLVRAFRSAVRESVPVLGYLGFYEYRVVGQSADRLDLQVTERGLGLPDLLRVPTRPGAAGSKAELAPGALVLVGFINGDDKRPYVAFYDAPGAGGFVPVSATLDATGTVRVGPSADAVELASGSEAVAAGGEDGRVVRYGDTIQMFLGAALVPTPIKLRRAGADPTALAGNAAAHVSKVRA